MKSIRKHSEQSWENRELGASASHTKRTSKSREKAVDDNLGLQMISIRLQKNIIGELKKLAHQAGIGYQPYIRQLLTQHVQNKKERTGTHG